MEEENRTLKQLVADLSLDKHMLQDVLKKNGKTSDATTDGPLSYHAEWYQNGVPPR